MKRINFIFILLAIAIIIFFVVLGFTANRRISQAKEISTVIDGTNEARKEATLIAVGDIMFHTPQIKSAFNGKTYDFKSVFEDIRPEIQGADLAIGNFETVVLPGKSYSGYPKFNVPVETLDAIKYAGFDVLNIANNHIMDQGQAGLFSTWFSIKKKGMLPIGGGLKNQKKYTIINCKGIKIGILSYTFGTNAMIAQKNTLNYMELKNIEKDIRSVRNECDFIIVYLHSGTEYLRTVEESQRKLYHSIAEAGADCILNSHPHVARSSEIYECKGRQVFINYSMGNFLSNQNDKFTDIGLMIKLRILKDKIGTRLSGYDIIPIYRLRYENGSKESYKVVLCSNIESYEAKLNAEELSYVKDMNNNLGVPREYAVFNH